MIERVFHPFHLWEDYKMGMYEKTCFMDDESMVRACEATLSCPELLWECMQFVSHNWGHAAEHNLTNLNRNRQAWLGQAACCFIDGAPEYLVKRAWNNLSAEKQRAANAVADEVIKEWEWKYEQGYFEWQNKRLGKTSSRQRKSESRTRSTTSSASM